MMNQSINSSCCRHIVLKNAVPFWANIPLISYVMLGGKCYACRKPISIQYPIVELCTAMISVYIAVTFGVTLTTLAALVFSWVLIALMVIDIHEQLLPDTMTIPMIRVQVAMDLNQSILSGSRSTSLTSPCHAGLIQFHFISINQNLKILMELMMQHVYLEIGHRQCIFRASMKQKWI